MKQFRCPYCNDSVKYVDRFRGFKMCYGCFIEYAAIFDGWFIPEDAAAFGLYPEETQKTLFKEKGVDETTG